MGDYYDEPDVIAEIRKMRDRIDALEAGRGLRPLVRYVGATGEPAFEGTWVNYDAAGPTARPAGFYLSGGRVSLMGVIRTGTIGTTAFTLPSGLRPVGNNTDFLVNSNGALGIVSISASTGAVVPNVGSNIYVFLDQISYLAA